MDDAAVLRLARQRCPGLDAVEVLAHTGKCVVVAGTWRQRAAVAKLLLSDSPLWRKRCAAEAAVYRAFAARTPPVAVPRLLSSDAEAGVLVLSRVDGAPAAHERHPAALPPAAAAAVLAAVDAIAAWRPPRGVDARVWDYPERFARYGPAGHGVFTGADVARLTRIDTVLGPDAWTFAHGDALPSNFLLGPHRTVVLDWEWAGRYRPGWDHALLWTLLRDDAPTRAALVGSAAAGHWSRRAGFWLNAALAAARELRLHRHPDPGPGQEGVCAGLTRDLDEVRRHLADLADRIRA
ncbi:phosphotransferase family protein [Nocardiopsis coralliicola]